MVWSNGAKGFEKAPPDFVEIKEEVDAIESGGLIYIVLAVVVVIFFAAVWYIKRHMAKASHYAQMFAKSILTVVIGTIFEAADMTTDIIVTYNAMSGAHPHLEDYKYYYLILTLIGTLGAGTCLIFKWKVTCDSREMTKVAPAPAAGQNAEAPAAGDNEVRVKKSSSKWIRDVDPKKAKYEILLAQATLVSAVLEDLPNCILNLYVFAVEQVSDIAVLLSLTVSLLMLGTRMNASGRMKQLVEAL
jgi:hypothetical protein